MPDHTDPLNWVYAKERKALKALVRIYGNDVDTLLNALHVIAARLAIGSGVKPDAFAQGVKYHWDFIVSGINESAAKN